jgi:hypothetical protein
MNNIKQAGLKRLWFIVLWHKSDCRSINKKYLCAKNGFKI